MNSEQIESTRLQLIGCKMQFNERFEEMQRRQLAEFKSNLSPESLLNLETVFGEPPKYMLRYYAEMENEPDRQNPVK